MSFTFVCPFFDVIQPHISNWSFGSIASSIICWMSFWIFLRIVQLKSSNTILLKINHTTQKLHSDSRFRYLFPFFILFIFNFCNLSIKSCWNLIKVIYETLRCYFSLLYRIFLLHINHRSFDELFRTFASMSESCFMYRHETLVLYLPRFSIKSLYSLNPRTWCR